MSLQVFTATGIAGRFGWTLVHSIWQGGIVALLLAVGLLLLRGRAPRHRYLASTAALVLMVACLVITFCRLPAPASAKAGYAPIVARTQLTLDAALPLPTAGGAETVVVRSDLRAAALPRPMPPAPSTPRALMDRTASFIPWLTGAWAFGVAGLSLWHLGGWIATRRLRVLGVRPVGADVAESAARIARRLKMARPPSVLQSLMVETPVVIGWARPVVLLPLAVLTGLTPLQLEAVLAHEFAHVRRQDYLVNLFQVAAETLLFYHPAAWFISRQIRFEREACCDDAAITICNDRYVYAGSLAALEEVRLAAPLAMAARGAGATQLLARIRRLLGQSEAPSRSGAAAAVLAVAVLIAVSVGALSRSAVRGAEPNSPDNRGAVVPPKENLPPAVATALGNPVAAKGSRGDDEHALLGRWASKSMTNSKIPHDAVVQTPGYLWNFDADKLTVQTSKDHFRYVVNSKTSPKELNIVGDRTLLLCIYELNGDSLKVAFYGRSELARPKGFDPKDNPVDADPLIVIEFSRQVTEKNVPTAGHATSRPDASVKGPKAFDLIGSWRCASDSVNIELTFTGKDGARLTMDQGSVKTQANLRCEEQSSGVVKLLFCSADNPKGIPVGTVGSTDDQTLKLTFLPPADEVWPHRSFRTAEEFLLRPAAAGR